MRRILVLAGLLGLMFVLHMLRIEPESSVSDPLTLAAIGFVVLAAFTVGELASVLRLPRITGYILGGIVLGPQLSNVLSAQIVQDMTVFNKLALGLIALSAGLELDVGAVRRVWKTLAATIALKIPLLVLFVGATFYAVERFYPLIGLRSDLQIIALGLILATLGIGTSPAIALAIINESKAKGRLTDITLAISVVKDLVVVLILALVLTALKVLLDPQAHFGSAALLAVGHEISLSLLVGAALGGLLILYLRFVGREMLIVVVATVLLFAEAAQAFHLELLLLFIAAGFVVRNFSRFEHALLTPLNKVALPVFVVFFTTAGAGVDLIGTLRILPLALALVTGRMIAFAIAARIGAKLGAESSEIGRHGWKAYISQAGVTLGLVIIAAEAFPDLADAIRQTGMAVVALNLLIGPILLGGALRKVREVTLPEGDAVPAVTTDTHNQPSPQLENNQQAQLLAANHNKAALTEPAKEKHSDQGDNQAPISAPEPLPFPAVDPLLQRWIDTSRSQQHALIAQFLDAQLKPMVLRSQKAVLRIVTDLDRADSVAQGVRDALSSAYPDLSEGLEDQLGSLHAALRQEMESSPRIQAVPLRPEQWRQNRGDRPALRVRKVAVSLGLFFSRKSPTRQVPLRVATRYAHEHRIAEALVNIRNDWFRSHLGILDDIRHLLDGHSSVEDCHTAIQGQCARFIEMAKKDLDAAVNRGHSELLTLCDSLGSPAAPATKLRLSTRSPLTMTALRHLNEQTDPWREVIEASVERLRALATLQTVVQGAQAVLSNRAAGPIETVRQEILPLATAFLLRLDDFLQKLDDKVEADAPKAQIATLAESLYTRRDQNRFRGLKTKFRQGTQTTELRRELAVLLETLPEQLTILGQEINPHELLDPSEVELSNLRLARDASAIIVDALVPHIAEAISELSEQVASGEERLTQAADSALYGLNSILAGEDDNQTWRRDLHEALTRVHERIAAYLADLDAALTHSEAATLKATERATHDLLQLVEGRRSIHVVRSSARETGRYMQRLWLYLRSKANGLKRRLLGAAIRASRQRRVRDWLIRSGQTRLDAASMHAYLRRFFPRPEQLKLPLLYHQVFSILPIDDPRLQTARKQEIEDLVATLRRDSQSVSANALIVGRHGSGRSSLFNLLERQLARHRILRLDPRYHRRQEGLVAAIANELGCSADFRSIQQSLKSKPLVILIDDLEHYLVPTPSGIRQLELFLQLVVATRSTTRWVLSVETSALGLLEQLVSIQSVFGRRVVLNALNWREVRALIEARARLSGLQLSFEGRQVFGRSLPWRGGGARDDYFKAITRVSGGNIRAAVLSHLRDVSQRSETTLLARYPSASKLPFADQIRPESLAVLTLLLRFGPMRRDELAEALGSNGAEVDSALLPLTDAALVDDNPSEESLSVPVHLENAIAQALSRQGLFAEGA